jgi:hypothetical protein
VIVRLSAQQWTACLQYGTERHINYLEHPRRVGASFRVINIPAAGLQTLIHEFEKVVFTPKWGKRKAKIPERSLRALRTLAQTLNTWTTHPAFNDGAIPGARNDVLAAWRRPGGGYEPYPGVGDFTLLLPDVKPWRVAGDGMVITRWTPGSLTYCDNEIIDEKEHLGWDL